MQKLARLAMPLVLLAPLTGCATPFVVTATNCEVGNRVTVSKHDTLTERTASEIEGNNRSREAAGCKNANKNG